MPQSVAAPRKPPADTTRAPATAGRRGRSPARGRRAHTWLRSPALALFITLASLYVLTSGGHTYSYDEETMFALTESLVERGESAIPLCSGCPVLRATPAPDGRNYSRYGPLQSLVAAPLYLAGRILAGNESRARWFITRFTADLLNPLVTATIAVLLYWLVRGLGYRRGLALATALLYGLATQAWPHAKTFFSEPLTAALLLGAVCCWWRLDRPARVAQAARWAAGVGLCCGLAIATKYGAAIALPVLGLAVAASLARGWRSGELTPRGAVVAAAGALCGLAAPLALLGLYNDARFASPFETGYGATEIGAIQGGDFATGLYGLLLSPGKSIFLFSPPVALALPAWLPFARRHRALALVCGGLVLTHLLFYARVPYWHGDVAWGPRYLDFVLPLLVLPLATGIAWLRDRTAATRRGLTALALPVIGAAVVVQLLGVLVNFDTAYNASAAALGRRHRDPANAPLALHARILRDRAGAWRETRFPREDGIIPTGSFVVVTETDPLWPRFLPREARLRVRAGGDGPVTGALLYQDARERRDPPQNLTILVDGRPAAGRVEAPAPESVEPAAYRVAFTIRPAGGDGENFAVTIRDEGFAQLGPTRLLAFVATVETPQGPRELPARRRPLVLPFPDDPAERFAWFMTERNQHLVDLWPWYVATVKLPDSLARLLFLGVGGGATLGLLLGAAGLLRTRD